jgi:hypothetical protein
MLFVWYNNFMKRNLLLLILVSAVLLVVGCSKRAQYAPNAAYVANRGFAYDDSLDYENSLKAPAFKDMSALMGESAEMSRGRAIADSSSFERPQETNDPIAQAANFTDAERKLVKTANVSIRVEDLEAADNSVAAMLKTFDAYAASTNIQENSRYYSLRVPANYYDIFLAEMNGMGRLISRYESTEDVTLRYYDLEGRLATKKELLKTFQSYLGKAKTIDEILSVERRISELQYDIEGTGKQLRNLADKVDYATIDLHLLGPVASASNKGLTFGERVKHLFGGFGGFLSTVVMVIIGIVIYGIPVLLLLMLLFLLLFGRIGLAKKLWRLIKS